MPEHIVDRYPTAAKAHECQTCGMVIEPMTRYRRAFMRHDGQAYGWVEHIECGELGRLSRLYGYDEDGGYSTATVEDWLRDESAETAMAKTNDEAVKARIRAWFAQNSEGPLRTALDLKPIKDRLAAATEFRREDYAEDVDGTYCVACCENIRIHDGAEYDPDRTVCDQCAAELWCHAAKDIAALIAEVERLRAVEAEVNAAYRGLLARKDAS